MQLLPDRKEPETQPVQVDADPEQVAQGDWQAAHVDVLEAKAPVGHVE